VLRSPSDVVQIGTVSDIAKAVPANFANAESRSPSLREWQRPFRTANALRQDHEKLQKPRRRLSILSKSPDLQLAPAFAGASCLETKQCSSLQSS